MSINSVSGVDGAQQSRPDLRVDQKEMEVAKKLINAGIVSSVQEFMQLSDTEKQQKVQKYNELNPQDPIEDKKNSVQQSQDSRNVQPPQYPPGSEMSQFMIYLNSKKIKL